MIDKIYEFDSLLRRRSKLIVATMVVGALAIVGFLLLSRPTYQASAQVLSVADKNGAQSAISFGDLPSVATSTVVLERVVNRLNLSTPLSALQGTVKARTSNGSQIISISYQSAIRDHAVAVPNAVADELAHYYEEISTRQADSDISKLNAAVDAQKSQLQAISKRLALTQVGGLAFGDDKAVEAISTRVDDLLMQRSLSTALLEGDRAAAKASRESADSLGRLAHNEILAADPVYKELSASGAKDETELAVSRGMFKPDFPGFPGLQTKVASVRHSLEVERQKALRAPDAFSEKRATSEAQARKADAVVIADGARIVALDRLIVAERVRMDAAPAATLASGLLQTQRDAARANYLALSSRLSTAVSNRSLALGAVVVLDRAVRADTVVVGLTRSKLVLLLTVLVSIVALGIAFIAESVDPRLLGPESIENIYGVPLVVTLKSE